MKGAIKIRGSFYEYGILWYNSYEDKFFYNYFIVICYCSERYFGLSSDILSIDGI